MKPALVRALWDAERREVLGPHLFELPPESLICPFCQREINRQRRYCWTCHVLIPEITDTEPERLEVPEWVSQRRRRDRHLYEVTRRDLRYIALLIGVLLIPALVFSAGILVLATWVACGLARLIIRLGARRSRRERSPQVVVP